VGDTTSTVPAHGLTPQRVADYLRVSRGRVLSWIRSGELGALNLAATRIGRPRYRILPEHLAAFAAAHRVGAAPKVPPRRRRSRDEIDYFPDL
jgi:excisionase family DNA binding protein